MYVKELLGEKLKDKKVIDLANKKVIFVRDDSHLDDLLEEFKNTRNHLFVVLDEYGGMVTVIAMGLPAASEVLRDSLYRGADDAILVTDRRCAASDTLATSYILSCAVGKLDYDIVLCGRQAGDY